MKKIISVALVVILILASSMAFAQTDGKYHKAAISNPCVDYTLADGRAFSTALTGLELAIERGKVEGGKAYAFDVSAMDKSALRAVLVCADDGVTAAIEGMSKAFYIPAAILSSKSEAPEDKAELDMASILDFTKDSQIEDKGSQVVEFMHGAMLTANTFSIELNDEQINAMIDSIAAVAKIASGSVSFDLSPLKQLEKDFTANISMTDNGQYIRIDCMLTASNGGETVQIPVKMLGMTDGNGKINVTVTAYDDEVIYNFDLHVVSDEKHPLRPELNAVFTINVSAEEVARVSLVTGSNHTETSSTHAMSFNVTAMGEETFKFSASVKEEDGKKAYSFKVGENDEMTGYITSETFEDELGKGTTGKADLDVNIEGSTVCLKADLESGVKNGAIDIGSIMDLPVIDVSTADENEMGSVKKDLYLIAVRAISVITEIPEIAALIDNELPD